MGRTLHHIRFHILHFRTLHSRLWLGIGMGWLVLAIVILLFALQIGNHLAKDSNVIHLEYEAALIADRIEDDLTSGIHTLQHLAHDMYAGQHSEEVAAGLRRGGHLDHVFGLFKSLLVVSPEGRVVLGLPQSNGWEGRDVGDHAYFSSIRQANGPRVSEPFVDAVTGKPVVIVGVPLLDESGGFAGMLGGVLSVTDSELFAGLSRIRIGEGGFVSLMTTSGRVLSHPNADLVMQPVPGKDSHPALNRALAGWEGVAEGYQLGGDWEKYLVDGDWALQAYRQVGSTDWVVGIYLPIRQIQQPIISFLRQLWWVGLVTALVILPLLWWLLRELLRPLRHLERQIARVGRGEASRVQLRTEMRELQQVADAFNDLEARRGKAMAFLQDRQAFLDAVLGASPAAMFVSDRAGRVTYINPAVSELTGYDLAIYRDSDWRSHIHEKDRQDAIDLWFDAMATGRDFQRQLRYYRSDGEVLWLEVHTRQVVSNGQSIGFVGNVKDITQRHEREALQRWEAEHDPLTGLLNRRGFERRLEEAMVEWQKTGTPSALILFDLDHFKPINDEGGHALGDEMLRRIAQVVAWEVRRSDHVARQGGDEFAVLMPSCTLTHAKRIAETLRKEVREICVTHAGKEYRVTLSIGVAAFDDGDHAIEAIVARADAACYQAKSQGRDGVILEVDGSR
ncbi:hypothetical protein GCM10007160_13600 [Litchfieldella qijiaojingensis]|uniref:Diguanylate cyclase n=1 Tax=Litchfieldella qijiaojingensis TaxID=980347 RepID=A0ABQ2YKP5_9GAMM|nr:diguanylate cyclase [Halomonas qijiaojingensis]GGX87481.1 hypothetical protein GCM10007160_13600 [Halomonas qijiaojingensis]